MARNVYLAIKGDVVVHHTDLSAMADMDGISKPDKTVTDEEWDSAGCLARIIDGTIFLGKTDAEKLAEAQQTVRNKRNKILVDVVDPVQKILVWNDMTEAEQTEWKAYRTALLNVSEQDIFSTDPDSVVWPAMPNI
jgi:hypothetical protein